MSIIYGKARPADIITVRSFHIPTPDLSLQWISEGGNMNKPRLTLPYSLVRQAAADMMLGASYATSTYFDPDVLARIERVLTNTLQAVFGKETIIEFVE